MGAPQERPGGIDYFTGLGGLTAIGILAYAVLRLSYWRFYSHFGVTPEEVGLGYIEILTRSAPLLVCAMAVVGLITWFFAGKLFEMEGRERVTVVAVAASLLFLVALFAGPIRASKLATVVEDGIPVHSRSFFELVPIQVDYVTLTADQKAAQEQSVTTEGGQATSQGQKTSEAIEVKAAQEQLTTSEDEQATSQGQSTPEAIEKRTSLLYFGQSHEIAVLYDHRYQQVIRVPMGEITIVAE
jgi:hypothetical protein